MRWDGRTWRRFFAQGVGAGSGAWGTRPEDIWVLGSFFGPHTPRLLHWNGREWRPVEDGVKGGLTREGLLRYRPAP